MILNKDYFDDLKLTDEDIVADVEKMSSVVNDISNPELYDKYLTSHYSRNIILTGIYYKDLYNPEHTFWKYSVPKAMRRIEYVLNVYNVEYEIVFRDNSGKYASPDYSIHTYKVNQYDVFSYFSQKMFFSDDMQHGIYINIYCNFPDFNYRESYEFIDRLQYAIWKDFRQVKAMYITRECLSLYDLMMQAAKDKINFTLNQYEREDYISRYDNVKMSYKQFIKDAILCFHDSPDDMKKIEDIIHEIKQGRKPNFKK